MPIDRKDLTHQYKPTPRTTGSAGSLGGPLGLF